MQQYLVGRDSAGVLIRTELEAVEGDSSNGTRGMGRSTLDHVAHSDDQSLPAAP